MARLAEVTALVPKCKCFLLHVEEQSLVVIQVLFFHPATSNDKRNFSRKLYTAIQKEQ